jgi:hypothetical protein
VVLAQSGARFVKFGRVRCGGRSGKVLAVRERGVGAAIHVRARAGAGHRDFDR